MDEKNLDKRLFNLVENNFEYLEECAHEAIIAVNNLLAQMRYYHFVQALYKNLHEQKNK